VSVDELRIWAEGIAIVHERTQMVWTRGDDLIHGLTQLGLLIDSLFLFLFRREEVDIYISERGERTFFTCCVQNKNSFSDDEHNKEIITHIY